MEHETKLISISVLEINTENPRFETVANQREAIAVMIESQKKKLATLAENIIKNGLNPSDPPIVTPNEKNGKKFKVLEGNRRITALKLLKNNKLIPEKHKSLLNRFKKLSSHYEENPIKDVSCVVFPNADEANKWIGLKHTGENDGIGTVTWDAQQKARFEKKVKGKTTSALQVIDFLKKDDGFHAELKNKLSQIPSSSLQRLLSDPDARETIGLTVENGLVNSVYLPSEIRKPLTKIITDLASDDFTVKDIYYKNDRLNYLETFKNSELPNKSTSVSKWEITTPSRPKERRRKPAKPPRSERNTIIPISCTIYIESAKINKIYEELKHLDLRRFVNAAAVTFRVFVELSVDHFAKVSSLQIYNNDTLNNKISKVTNYLKEENLLTKEQLKPVDIAISSPNSILSVNTFNAYVHNEYLNPIASDLKTTWDNLEPFILKMWESK